MVTEMGGFMPQHGGQLVLRERAHQPVGDHHLARLTGDAVGEEPPARQHDQVVALTCPVPAERGLHPHGTPGPARPQHLASCHAGEQDRRGSGGQTTERPTRQRRTEHPLAKIGERMHACQIEHAGKADHQQRNLDSGRADRQQDNAQPRPLRRGQPPTERTGKRGEQQRPNGAQEQDKRHQP
jgi:hypothetical protein